MATELEEAREEIATLKRLLQESRATAARRQSTPAEDADRFEAVFHTSPIGMTISTLVDGKILDGNDAALRMYGFTRAEAVGRTVAELNTYANPVQREQLVALVRANGVVDHFPIDFRHSEGRIGAIVVSCRVLMLQGQVCLVAMLTDMTERLRTEAALRQSEERLRQAMHVAKLGIWSWDLATDETTWYGRMFELYGVRKDEFTGRGSDYIAFTREDYRSAQQANIKLALSHALTEEQLRAGVTLASEPKELCIVRPDGSEVFTLGDAVVIADADGTPTRMLGVTQDITEKRRAEAERASLQAQLTQAQKMESVGRLAGGVAHDFNNMLSVILGNVEMALADVDPEQELYADLVDIRDAATRAAKLTGQLLAFARKQVIAPVELDLNDAVTGTLTLLRRLIGENIDVRWQPAADLWPVKIDPSQVDQILANLCVNARDAITDVSVLTIATGTCTLDETYCETHADVVPGDYVRLVVSDNGSGMDAGTLSHLFEPFFTTKAAGRGTGLGLATVFGIVKQNGGSIGAESAPGRGTTFTVHLPRYFRDGRPTSSTQRPPTRRVALRAQWRGNRRLVARSMAA